MNVTATIKEAFEEEVKSFKNGFKIHVKELNCYQLLTLAEIAESHDISVKRSGTGLTVLITEPTITTENKKVLERHLKLIDQNVKKLKHARTN